MSEKIIRWGIIGCGDVTERKSGPAFNKISGSTLTAVMRRDFAKAQDYAKRHSVPHAVETAEALINHPEVDVVYIATPPDAHAKYAIMAAEAGKPVYVEKPMARTAQECEWMIKAAEHADVPIWVAYYRRCLPNFTLAKKWIEEGAIGKVRMVSIRLFKSIDPEFKTAETPPWRVVPEISGGGLFVDLASHQLDVLDFILGPIEQVVGWAGNQAKVYQAEDIVLANWQHQSGVMGSGSWCFTTDPAVDEDRIEFIGEKGKITLTTFEGRLVVLESKHGTRKETVEYPDHIQSNLIQTIVDELNGNGSCPSTGISAMRTAEVMDAILENYRKQIGFKI